MLKGHQDIILSNLSALVEKTNLDTLAPELLNRGVFNQQMINRILNPRHSDKRQKTDLYVEILKRGPKAFSKLLDALLSTNHFSLAQALQIMESQQTAQLSLSLSSLNSVGSNISPNSSDNETQDGPCLSRRKVSSQLDCSQEANSCSSFVQNLEGNSLGLQSPPQVECEDHSRLNGFQNFSLNPSKKVFSLPAYDLISIRERLRNNGMEVVNINYTTEQNRPVHVIPAKNWQSETYGRPDVYKMESFPRGHALILNNKYFYDKEHYPDRRGSENDVLRATKLLEQLFFKVEVYQNKTRMEMEHIVKTFSQKRDLYDADCVIVIFMSHGEEGLSDEGSQVIGIDGIGYESDHITAQFYNDVCPALIDKPKLFFYQACRGNLTDEGVKIDLNGRIETDGKGGILYNSNLKMRTYSDIFMCFPSVTGRQSNRDHVSGSWFIQAIVDVFSEFACNAHLEDLMKMVDRKIKQMNNLYTSNFQSVCTKTVGWHKNLYFNPGLYIDKNTSQTVRICTPPEEGMDVVDTIKNSNYQDGNNGEENVGGCFNFSKCCTLS